MIANPATPPNSRPREATGPAQPAGSLNEGARRIQQLVEEVDALPDAEARALVQDLLQSVMQLHGAGLERILRIVADGGAATRRVYDEILADGVARSLLLIHDLHPVGLEERLHEALAKVLPYIHSHGGDVELVSLQDGFAKLRLQGTCKGCPSSAVTMDLAVRAAIEEFCPDLVGFEVEGASAHPQENGLKCLS